LQLNDNGCTEHSVQTKRIGLKQMTFASAAWNRKGRVTRRERFLAEMDAEIPWERLL